MSTLGEGFWEIMVYWSSKVKPCGVPKSRYRKLSLRVNRNLAFFDAIATHLFPLLAGLAMTEWEKGFVL